MPAEQIYDDFGTEDGHQFFKFSHEARQYARFWRPQAVGRRPMDWARRDLILGGARRGPENWPIRVLMKNRTPWLFSGTFRLEKSERDIIARCRVFMFFHCLAVRRCFRLEHPLAQQRAQQLLSCCPRLFLLARQVHPHVQTCGFAKQCPYCLSRLASRLYARISKKLVRSADHVLVLAKVRIDVPSLAGNGDGNSAFSTLRNSTLEHMRAFSREIGSPAGLFTFQCAPQCQAPLRFRHDDLDVYGNRGFHVHAALLTQVPIDVFRDDRDSLASGSSGLPQCFLSLTELGEPQVVIEDDIGRDALRSLIFGEYPGNRNGADRDGYSGALAYHSWHLASPQQWQEHLLASNNQRAFTLLGDWAGGEPTQARPRLPGISQRRARQRQIAPLMAANGQRRELAESSTEALLEQVSPLLDSFRESHGKLPGRTRLKRVCWEAGIQMSDRQARAILKRVSQSFQIGART